MNFETAYNLYMGLPGDGDTLELTVNRGHAEPDELGDGYNHMAVAVRRDPRRARKPGNRTGEGPYSPGGRDEVGRICFVRDPDGYRIELIDGGDFATPQNQDIPAS